MVTRTSTTTRIVNPADFPTLPHVSAKLIQTWHEGDGDLSKIAAIIRMDPALSHTIMGMAYHAKNHQPGILHSLEKAIQVLGPDTMRAIISHVLTQGVFEPAGSVSIKNLTGFWQHATACAHASELIARETSYAFPREAFLAGLLHDMGKLVLLSQDPKKYQDLVFQAVASAEQRLAEEKALGIDHATAGAQLIQTWGQHTFIADAILYHHRSLADIQNALPLVQIVYTANLLAASPKKDPDRQRIAAQKLFGFNVYRVDEIGLEMNAKVQDSIRFLGLEDSAPAEANTASIQNTIQQEVKDTALLGHVIQRLLEAVDRSEIIREIKQALWVLFDVNDTMLFLYEPQAEMLIEQVDDPTARDTMAIPMRVTECLPVSSILQKEIVDSFTQSSPSERTILDNQLIGRLANEGMLCVPLLVKDTRIGCILLGMNTITFPFLSKQFNLLELIARQSAAALYVERERDLEFKMKLSHHKETETSRSRKIVHEATNPLGIIKNYLKVLEKKLSEHDVVCDEIRIIDEEISRVGLILKGLTSTYTESPSQTMGVDLNQTLSDMARLLGATLKSQGEIEIHLNLDDDLPAAGVDKNSFKQIAMNLLKNAAEAMPEGGSIHVQTSYISNGTSAGNWKQAEPKKARILIRDNGPGLPDMVRARLFEQHVTSKPNHEGLGLSVVKNLVHMLEGSVACESSHAGTSFTIEVPI